MKLLKAVGRPIEGWNDTLVFDTGHRTVVNRLRNVATEYRLMSI